MHIHVKPGMAMQTACNHEREDIAPDGRICKSVKFVLLSFICKLIFLRP